MGETKRISRIKEDIGGCDDGLLAADLHESKDWAEKPFAGLAGGKRVLQRSRGKVSSTYRGTGASFAHTRQARQGEQGSFLSHPTPSSSARPRRRAAVCGRSAYRWRGCTALFLCSTFASCSNKCTILTTARASPGQNPTSYPVNRLFSPSPHPSELHPTRPRR